MATTQQSTTTTSVTRTSYESSSGHSGGSLDGTASLGQTLYKSQVHPRSTIVVQRTGTKGGFGGGYGGGFGGGSMHVESSMQRSLNLANSSSGAYQKLSQAGVGNVLQTRSKEKKDMQDLNERLASYIEKVRFLEAQNKKLVAELDDLKSKWGKETNAIKAMYETELHETRCCLDNESKERVPLELKITTLADQNHDLTQQLEALQKELAQKVETIDRQNTHIADTDAELSLLRKRVHHFEEVNKRDKAEIKRLQDQLQAHKTDLDNETLNRCLAENDRQSAREELEFLKNVHEQELKELACLAYRDTTPENREFWKNELAQAIHDIQAEYENRFDGMRGDMESLYQAKIQEYNQGATRQNMEAIHSKEEVKKLRDNLNDIRAKLSDLQAKYNQLHDRYNDERGQWEAKEAELCKDKAELSSCVARQQDELESIMAEVQNLLDAKLSLELEIAAYRKLLEGEETRIGLRSVMESVMGGGGGGGGSSFGMEGGSGGGYGAGGGFGGGDGSGGAKGEMSAKTTYQRSAKGPISITECSGDGKFICLENTGNKEENLNKYSIKRNIDGKQGKDFTFPDKYSIPAGKKIKIWARNQRPAGSNELECNERSWGVGANIQTQLCSDTGEEKAKHVQATTYAS